MSLYKSSWLLCAFWLIPNLVWGQTEPQGAQPAPPKPKVTFSQNMNQTNRELDWSRTYYLSFQKTKEAIYLKLAGAHCANAIKVLKATQASFPNTTRFHYKAKNKRYTACRFFEELQETALRLGPSHHIQDLPNEGCDF